VERRGDGSDLHAEGFGNRPVVEVEVVAKEKSVALPLWQPLKRLADGGALFEVAGGLGPDAPPIWRVGLMGVNAHVETADRLLEAFDAVLAPDRTSVALGSSS